MTTTRPPLHDGAADSDAPITLTGLYVPADRPDRIAKALASEADVVIVDLEDAVHPRHKEEARRTVTEQLGRLMTDYGAASSRPVSASDRGVQVRINPHGSRWHAEDLEAVRRLPATVGVRVPKVEDPETLGLLIEELNGHAAHALIESPRGVEHASEIAGAGIATVGLGEADLVSALGVENADMLTWQRSRVLNAAAAAELPPPWMSVYSHHRDLEGLRRSCEAGRRAGFLGRAAIHPAQLPVIREAFLPTPAEQERAARTLEAMSAAEDAGAGVWVLEDGSFVDTAMVGWARRVMAISGAARQAT
ncbi:MAG: HpcH/HpaI aldolase/citrate lyase family protein [Dermabacteraceae bacterium]